MLEVEWAGTYPLEVMLHQDFQMCCVTYGHETTLTAHEKINRLFHWLYIKLQPKIGIERGFERSSKIGAREKYLKVDDAHIISEALKCPIWPEYINLVAQI
jgi:hypothetical protein